jgi:hypothetical protein
MEETTIYYRLPDGSLVVVKYTGTDAPPPPEGAVEISEEVYLAELAAIQAANEASAAAQRAAECATMKEAYDLLRGIGMSHEAASSVSRWSPELCPPPPDPEP